MKISLTAVESTPDRYAATWAVPDDLPWLAGHFPDYPVLPAAVIMEISLAFLRQTTGNAELAVTGARHCKFKGPCLPGATYRIEAERLARPGDWEITWTGVDPIVELILSVSHG